MINKGYGLHGKLVAIEGQAGRLADILQEAAQLVAVAKGCRLYLISNDASVPNAVWITEVWDSKEAHHQSLQIPGVGALIAQAVPLLAEKPQKGQELQVFGGYGL